jgi:hypothetical protein
MAGPEFGISSTRLLPPGGRLARSLEDGSRVEKDTQKIRE